MKRHGCDVARLLMNYRIANHGVINSRTACRYLASSADLQRFAACLHLLQDFPHAILIDDICSFTEDRYVASQKYCILGVQS